MKLTTLVIASSIVIALSSAGAVLADDWTADRLRGIVMQLDGTDWRPVVRGEVISDDRHIRTLASGRVEFVRGAERISVGGDTDIQISDAAGSRRMTTVLQLIGTVSIEAERRNVQHFSVLTPYLAAVVKGTRFTVRIRNGASNVVVDRGVVQVRDTVHDVIANVIRGQAASVSDDEVLQVSGPGAVSTVQTLKGEIVERNDIVEKLNSDNSRNNSGGNGRDKNVGNHYGISGGSGHGNTGGNGNRSGGSGGGNNGGGGGSNGGGNNGGGGGSNGGGNSGGGHGGGNRH
ncbi:FecR domain-containing protein [Devosia rhodophyticola]|uniref:FecR domain-containing protein n=1 Tax=Devosia rhodophyticola TaxID=3026423 RepID=A0ABY7YTR5_9HYPH|nr:FecR domain-containing protein [Devosia rhodophyticola]WDR04776.1 FecR domain-containing protein [Devosia rhodophyticola]